MALNQEICRFESYRGNQLVHPGYVEFKMNPFEEFVNEADTVWEVISGRFISRNYILMNHKTFYSLLAKIAEKNSITVNDLEIYHLLRPVNGLDMVMMPASDALFVDDIGWITLAEQRGFKVCKLDIPKIANGTMLLMGFKSAKRDVKAGIALLDNSLQDGKVIPINLKI